MNEGQLSLLFGNSGNALYQYLLSYYIRFPSLFPKKLFSFLVSFFANCPEPFLSSHSASELSHIFFAQCRLSKKALASDKKIHTAVIELNPATYGIAIAIFSLDEKERFNNHYIIKGLQNLISGIKEVPNSYFFLQKNASSQAHLYYVEIKKIRGGIFYPEDREKILHKLPLELKQGIEPFSHALFLPGNEEELFKNIRHLNQEIKYFHDLPQVMITFVEYFPDKLKFLVIVVRLLKEESVSIQSQCSHLPSLIHFSLEDVFLLDRLRNKYFKEATVFTLEINSALFIRSHAINLRSARQYVVKVLEALLGPFRDYNGGLLCKEGELLTSIKKAVEEKGLSIPFLEELFYSIKPLPMRALISKELATEMVALLHKMISWPLAPDKKYLVNAYCTKELELVIIKTQENEWKNSLSQRITSGDYHIGSASVELEGFTYLCFFHQESHLFSLVEKIENELSLCTSAFIDREKSILRINFQAGDPPSLNPHLATDIHCHILANLLFEGLTKITPTGVELAVAEKVDISATELEYTFHLRKCFWSNGEPVTAYHFEKAWKKALMGGSTHIFPSFFSSIKNAKRARKKSVPINSVGISAKDDQTLHILLEEPIPYFLNLVATPPFFPLFSDFLEPTEFNGPFTLAKWQRDQYLSLSQNPFYWNNKKIALSGIKIHMVRNPDTAFEMFKRGELDFIGDPISPLAPEIVQNLSHHPHLYSKEVSRIFWIHCNTEVFPLNNAKLRRALSLALNRETIVEKVFIKQIPQSSPLPTKYASFKNQWNPTLAQAYFKEALKELKLEPEEFPSIVLTHSDLSFDIPLMEELKKQWKEVLGITIQSKRLPWNEFSAALERKNFQLGGLFRRDFFNDPFFYLGFFKPSSANAHSWENSEYESLLQSCLKTKNREPILKKLELLIMEEAPVIPLVNQRCFALVSERIKGIDWNENGCLDLCNIYISQCKKFNF